MIFFKEFIFIFSFFHFFELDGIKLEKEEREIISKNAAATRDVLFPGTAEERPGRWSVLRFFRTPRSPQTENFQDSKGRQIHFLEKFSEGPKIHADHLSRGTGLRAIRIYIIFRTLSYAATTRHTQNTQKNLSEHLIFFLTCRNFCSISTVRCHIRIIAPEISSISACGKRIVMVSGMYFSGWKSS